MKKIIWSTGAGLIDDSKIFYPFHFVRTILSIPLCPIPFFPYTILSIPFCPYRFVPYHFVLEPFSFVILDGLFLYELYGWSEPLLSNMSVLQYNLKEYDNTVFI